MHDHGHDNHYSDMEALTGMLAMKGIVGEATVLALQEGWKRAAEATPHGRPILLENDPSRN